MKVFYGIKGRWLVSSLLIVITIVVIAVFTCYFAISSYYYSGMQSSLESRAETSTAFFMNYINNTYAEYYRSVYSYTESFDDRNIMEMQFVDANGEIVISTYGLTTGTSPGTPDIGEAIETKGMSTWRGDNPETGERVMAVSAPLVYSDGQVIGVVRYITSLKLVDSQVGRGVTAAIAIGIAIIGITILSNVYFIRTIIGPINQITALAGRISEGSYGIQIEKKYNDEIGKMTDAINNMSMKINQTEKLKTEFISSVSHELRTPLTAITGWGETLLFDENLSADQRRGLHIISSEAGRLTKLVEELLEFTRIEDGRFTLNVKEVDIDVELKDVVRTYGEFLRHNDIALEYKPYDGEIPMISGDPERLKQVFYNILENAAKHASDGEKIIVSLDLEPENVAIRIRDFGPGIPEDEIENVKMKFYKGSSKARGTGIGLAVCEEIIRYHEGSFELKNAESSGLVVTIRLPLP